MTQQIEKVIPELLMDLPVYDTCYKGSIPYNVYINEEQKWISVYGIPKKTIWVDSDGEVDEDECGVNDIVTHIENTSLYWDKDVSSFHSNLLLKCYFTELFKGEDLLNNCTGNSILIKTVNGSYTYIGDRIYNFTIPHNDIILEFHSPIYDDNSYPVAVGEKNIYFMLHGVYADKMDIDLEEQFLGDAYYKFYYKHGYNSSNTIFKLYDNIKIIDNGYYFKCDDLIEESIIRHKNIKYEEEIQKYEINFSKYVIDQVKESEEYKKICYSIYNIDNSDSDSDNSDNDSYNLKDDLEWVSKYVPSLVI